MPHLRPPVITIDGSRGEGGGQVARVALSLAAATGAALRVERVRAGRPQPGLKPQHVAACRALAELTGGTIEGAHVGSEQFTFRPGPVSGGEYRFPIETAGSITLLLQALLPALVASRQRFDVSLSGGTNVAWAPQWEDFVHVHCAHLRRLGVDIETELVRRGFHPQGGGEVRVRVETPARLRLDLTTPGDLRALHAIVPSHGLPRHVMERASRALEEQLNDLRPVDIVTDFHRGPGTGMAVAVRAEMGRSVLGGDAVGRKGTPVEDVVTQAVQGLRADLAVGAGVDVHQADQLPVFLALGAGGAYTCRHLTPHARTVLDILPEFVPVRVAATVEGRLTRVDIEPLH